MNRPHAVDFDTARFGRWLAERTGTPAELSIEPIRGGGSGELFTMRRLGRDWIIRRAPITAVSDTAHDVLREYRIYEALQGGDAPVPALLTVGDDTTLMGAAFFIMEYIDGVVIRRDLPPAYLADPPQQTRIGEQLVDTLAALHGFAWQDSTLAQLAHPDGFLERQVGRWLNQLAGYRFRDMPGVDEVADWLDRHCPRSHDLSVMHGDYKLDNLIFSHTTPPTVHSVLDFEMTTVGDPLIDLAWAMIFWPDEGNSLAFAAPGTPGGMTPEHCQTSGQLVSRYADITGRDLSNLQWYQAFSAWKLAIVLEASYAGYRAGRSRNPLHQFFGTAVDNLLQRARSFAE